MSTDYERDAWLRFDHADDVTTEEWIVMAKVWAAFRARTAQDDVERA